VTKILHTYLPRDVDRTDHVRFIVADVSTDLINRGYGGDEAIPREVWSTRVVSFFDHDAVSAIRRQAFEECCKRNGGRPRHAHFGESIALAAELKAMPDVD
jgi:hypothetical protein